jgi:hypothetical protein
MSDLHRAVEEEVDAYLPDTAPPFSALLDRHRRRARRRTLTAAVPVAAALVAASVAWSAAGGGEELVQRAGPAPGSGPAAGPGQVRYSLTYADADTYLRHEQAIEACLALPGVTDVRARTSLPPKTTLTITGRSAGQELDACLDPLAGVTLVPVSPAADQDPDRTSEDGTRYSIRYDSEAAHGAQDRAVRTCLDLPGISDVSVEESLPPAIGAVVTGLRENAGFRRCLGKLTGVTVTDLVPYDPSTAPQAFVDRTSLPSCGRHAAGMGPVPRAAIDCFADAVGGPQGAEYAVSTLTPEGDPVVRWYRALPGQQAVEVFIDATRDDFGSESWQQATCTGYDRTTGAATGCSPNGTGSI